MRVCTPMSRHLGWSPGTASEEASQFELPPPPGGAQLPSSKRHVAATSPWATTPLSCRSPIPRTVNHAQKMALHHRAAEAMRNTCMACIRYTGRGGSFMPLCSAVLECFLPLHIPRSGTFTFADHAHRILQKGALACISTCRPTAQIPKEIHLIKELASSRSFLRGDWPLWALFQTLV